jgi:peptide/nickel transport system permease protein
MSRRPPLRRYPIPTKKHPPHRPIPPTVERRAWYQLPSTVTGLAILGLVLLGSFVGPALADCDALTMDVGARLAHPSAQHLFGTDQFGRDVFCRALHGGRISLPVGIAAVLTALLPGVWLGLLAGYYGGWLDTLVGNLTDIMLAFPGILMALLIIAWLGVGLGNAMLAIGLSGIPRYIRMARSSTAELRRAWFVRAARVVGCTHARILARHILPNVLPTIIALAALDIAWAILNAAALSFLGLGAQPPTPEWGAMINEGRGYLRLAPWISLAPGMMMTLTVLGINLLGDGLRDTLDPRTR